MKSGRSSVDMAIVKGVPRDVKDAVFAAEEQVDDILVITEWDAAERQVELDCRSGDSLGRNGVEHVLGEAGIKVMWLDGGKV